MKKKSGQSKCLKRNVTLLTVNTSVKNEMMKDKKSIKLNMCMNRLT